MLSMSMSSLKRFAAAALGLAAILLAVTSMVRAGSDVFAVMIQALLLTGAAFLLWFAALGNQSSERTKLARTLQIGAVVGGIALVAGFFGPLLFSPGSNQGPLLGIFITGPAGFVLGCIGGLVWTKFFSKS
jgi:hypothetical protein